MNSLWTAQLRKGLRTASALGLDDGLGGVQGGERVVRVQACFRVCAWGSGHGHGACWRGRARLTTRLGAHGARS
eukprot:7230940-Prymnesium_polylepis.1